MTFCAIFVRLNAHLFNRLRQGRILENIEINNYRLEYSEQGIGEPVIFVHGSASDYRTWHAQRDVFAQEYRTIVYSRRYHYPNPAIPEGTDYSMEEHANDLETLIHLLDAKPAHLVGHSYGAFLCLLIAMKEPRLVRSLVLAEPPVMTLFVSNTPKPTELLKLFVTRPRTAAAVIKFGAKGVAPASKAFRQGDMEKGIRLFGDAVFGKGSYDHLSGSRKAMVDDNLSNVKAELLGSGFLPLDEDRLRNLRIHALLITGGRSISLFRHLINRLEELLPQTERIEIPGALHAMHEDNAGAYNAAVLSFLKKYSPPA
ncbi:alpha/beta fold hydrolase [candidate division KSB1 bacterium]|nr:alpha/beta fold hydrolase [candidate division KSB1 bacterium]